MRDFTLKSYTSLLHALKSANYETLTLEQYMLRINSLPDKFIILRHDVDLKAKNSLATAIEESKLGIVASYYFRVIPESNQPEIIKPIAKLGHEIGYHYEDMSICGGDSIKAIEHFKKWLKYFRNFYPVKTICMHGAPQSKHDGKDLWKIYKYQDYGIIGEPYFDVNFDDLFYITDTGRMWDGYKYSVRDKVPQQDKWNAQGLNYHSTEDIIKAIKEGSFPKRVMMTTHPQRWSDDVIEWSKELLLQSAKNLIKGLLLVKQ